MWNALREKLEHDLLDSKNHQPHTSPAEFSKENTLNSCFWCFNKGNVHQENVNDLEFLFFYTSSPVFGLQIKEI